MANAENFDSELQKIEEAYDSPNWWYDVRGFFILNFSYRDSLFRQIRFFSENIHGRHLEAAIGTGTLTQLIYYYTRFIQRKPRWQGVGFDYSERMLEGAKGKIDPEQFNLLRADVGALPFSNNEFDTINVANAMHCFPDINVALKELYRVQKSKGAMYVNVILYDETKGLFGEIARNICDWGIKKGILVRPYHQHEVEVAVTKVGYQIKSSRRVGNSLYLIAEKS